MKLHLPVKLRASLIAAVIAVPALVYNAFAGENYTAPSDAFGWDNNDIEFTAKLMETAGNTYTAREDVKYALYDGTNKPVGLIEENGTTVELTYDAASGKYLHPTEVDTEGNPILVTPTAYKVEGTDGTPAEIIVATKDYEKVSYLAGDTTMDADSVDIRNSLASVTEAAGSATPYAGDVSITTDDLKVSTDNTRVVLEDANVEVSGTTTVSDDSQLVILNGTGAADQFSTVEQGLLGIDGIPVNDVNDGDSKTVALGAVSGGGSVTVIGDGSNVAASMDSVNLSGSLNLGDADASVSGDVKATEIALVGSETDVGGDVTFDGIVVDADSVLDATGNVSNAAHGGAGYVDVAGEVYADGNVFLDNGKADKDLGIKDGAVVDAGGDATLRNVDAVKADQITADGDLTLVSGSTIEGLKETDGRTDNISAGGDLVVGDGSSVKDAEISVGGNVVVSNDAPGLSVGSLDSSSITNTDITVTPTGTSNVTINGGSSMTSSSIVGANGQIDITDDSTVTDSLIDMDPDATDGVNHDLTVSDSTVTNSSILDVDGSATVTNSELDKVTVTVATDTTAAPSDVTIADSTVTESSISGATGAVSVSNSTVTDSTIDMDPDAADGVNHDLTVSDSTVTNSSILDVDGSATVTNSELDKVTVTVATDTTAAPSTVTLANSSMTDSSITGGTGDITVDDSTVTVTDESGATRNFIGADKENLAGILEAAGATTPLTGDSLADKGLTVGSVIGNTSGNVTITDSSVDSTLVTGGGDITIADTENTPDASQAIANVKDIIADALANPVDGAVVVPYVETNAEFGTVVDGSIIDVRGNLGADPAPENDLTVDSAALTNSVLLGVTGKITVSDSLLGNDYIDGGSGIEIDNSVIVDTDIVNMNADIVLKDNISIISTDEDKPFVMTTKGTAEITDYDEYTGGSIILEGADLQNGVIKSGVTAERNADGTYAYTPTTSATDAMVDDGTGSLTPLGTKLPYGQIKVTDSALNKMDISTVAGAISVTDSSVAASAISTGSGDVTLAGTIASSNDATAEGWTPANTVVDSTITTGAGNIAISKTLVDSSDVTTGAGNIGITTSKVVDSNIISEGAGDVRIEAASLVETSVVSTVEGNVTITGASSVLGSDVSTEDGALSVNGSTVNSVTVDGTLDKSTLTATDDSNIINGSYVSGTDITISDTDGDGVAPGLDIYGNALTTVEGDVNMAVDGRIYVNTNGKLALDGDKEGDNTRDASVTADSLVLNDIYDKQSSIANAQVAVTTKTMLKDGNTLTLDSVNSAEGEAAGTLGDLLQMGDPDVQDNNGNWSEAGITTVAIKGGSILEAGRIGVVTYASQGGDSVETADVTNAHNYFDKITVVEDSKVTASGKALVNTLHVNVDQADTTTAGSKVTFEQDAYLTNAQIRGEGEKTYLGNNQDGPEVTIKGNGHVGNLRMDNEGAISFVGDGTQKSYIADIAPAINGEVHGVINVVNGELVTPALNHGSYLSLGLNGGTVTLDSVTAEQGATIASTDAVNAHVKLDLITNASQTGAPDVTPVGQSTIKTTLDRVTTPYSYTAGTPTETVATTYYYKVMSETTAAAETTVQRWNGTALETVTVAAGETLKSGDIITKTDKALTYFTKADGSTVANGVTTSDAAVLTPAEESYLVRITVPLVDAEGNLCYEETALGTALVVGQTVTQNTLSYQDGVAESGGTITEMTDGIASLTVLENMDSDNTVINAYETGRYTYYAADGTVLDPATATPEELAAATKSVVADANSGYINIQGALTGQDNSLYADNNIRINGIVADADNRDYENGNTVVSGRGNITVAGSGIFGSSNTVDAKEGSVTVSGIKGNDNELTAADEVQINGIVAGNDNSITAGTYVNITQGIGTVDDETSDGNTVLAKDGDVTLGAHQGKSIHGNSNSITAEQGDIAMSGKILGNENILTAKAEKDAEGAIVDGGNISGTSVEGNKNQLLADAAITLTGSVKGDENVLNAGTSIAVTGNIEGNKNDLDAGTTISTADIIGDENTLDAGESITTAAITGNKNALTAGTSIETADITGDENVLNAGTSIETGAIAGNKNDLDAGTTITTEDITGDENTLDAGESITTGSIAGDKNALTAGTSIATDDITGNENELEAGTSIDTGSVTGNDNLLTAKDGDVTIDGNLDGAGNIVSSEKQNIVVTGDVIGGAAGTPNSLTAAGAVSIEGNLGGVGTDVTAYANGLGQDDVAISVGSFNAQGTDLTIATTNDATYGYASGNGSIIIGSMNAVDGAVDSALVNNIISNNSYVQIGAMNGYNAYTNITAAKDVIVGTNASSFALRAGATEQSAANQTIKGANFLIQDSVANLTLTDSTVNVTNSISGTGLTLTTTASGMMAPVFTSSANSVTLDSLEIAGNALLTATTVTLKDLTIDGTYATLVATNLTATGKLTLKNGAVFDINRVKVSGLEIENSQLDASTLVGIQELTLTNANAYISGGLTGMTGDVVLRANEEGDGSFLFTSVIDIDGALDVSGDSDAVVSGNITADKSISATGGSTISGLKITSQGAITAAGDSTITANSKLKGQSLNVDASTVNATSVELSGVLSALNGSAVNSNVTGATNATITDSTVGDIAMNGILNASNATLGDVTGAISATLDDADTGSISMAGDNGNITITNASLVQGNVSNAHDVTINGSKVTGTVQTDGALNAANANIQGGLTADSVVTSATISGSTISSGITSSGEVAITDKSTIIGAVSGTGVSVSDSSTGDVTATTGNATIKDSAVGDVKAENGTADLFVTTAGTVTATDAIIEGSTVSDIVLSGSLEASNSTLGTVTGATSATLDDVSSGSISMAGDNGDITIENNSLVDGNVTNAHDVTINGSMVTGTVQTDGALNATNANIQGGLTEDSVVTSANISGSTIGSGITSSGAVTITDKSTISGAVSGTDVSVSDSSTGDVTADGAVSVENAQTGTLDGATVSTNKATVNGSVNADTAATLTGGTVSGNVEVTDGAATITGTEITGTVTADSVAMTGGTAGDVTADNGDATIDGGAEVGDVTASGTVSVENATTGTLDGATVSTKEATVNGSVNADTAATLTGGTVSGNVDVTDGAATITGTKITGTVTADSVDMTGGTAGDVTADNGDATIDGGAVVGTVTAASGTAMVDNATVLGSVGAAKADLNEARVTGNVEADSVIADNATITGNVMGDTIEMSQSDVGGDVQGTDVVLKETDVTGSVLAETSAVLTGGSVGVDVTVSGENGTATVIGTTVSGKVTADYVETQGADIKGELVINKGATFTGGTVTDDVDVKSGTVQADGTTFLGSVSADNVNISGGSVAGSVTADEANAVLSGVTVGGDVTAEKLASLNKTFAESVMASDVMLKDSSVQDVTATTGSATVIDTLVSGSVSAVKDSILTGGSVSGNVNVTDGAVSITGTEITGTVTADSVDMTGGTAGDVTADNGDATIDGGAVVGDVTAANGAVSVEDATTGTLDGATVSTKEATVNGSVNADTAATLTGGTVSGNVNVTDGAATITGTKITGTVTADSVDMTGGTAGDVTADNGDATIDGSAVVGTVTAGGTVSVENAQTGTLDGAVVNTNGATVTGNVEADTAASLTGGTVSGYVNVTDGAATITGTEITGTVTADSVAMTGGTAGNVTADNGDATIDGGAVVGDVTAANGAVSVENATTGTLDGATVSTKEATVNGSVNADTAATLTGGTVSGNVEVTDGTATITGTEITGTVTADSVAMTGGTAGNVTADNGDATIDGGAVVGDVTAANKATLDNATAGTVSAKDVALNSATTGAVTATDTATISGGSVSGDVKATTATITGAEIAGNVEATTADITGGKAGNVTATDATIDGGAVVGNVTATNKATLDNATAGTVSAKDVALNSATTGAVTATDTATISGGSVSGDVKATTATITGAEIAGNVEATTADITGGKAGNVTATDATIDGGAVVGNVTAANKATLDNATAGTVSAKDVALNSATTGAVTATDTATISGGSVSGDVTATTATITGAEIAGNVEATTADITGGKAGNVTATDATIDGGAVVGNVTAAGTVDVANAQTGAVSGSAVSLADASTGAVTAETLVATGTVAAEGTVTADSMTVTDGTLTADAVTVSGVASISSASVTAQTLQAASVSGDDAVINASITAGDVTLKDSTAKDMTMTGKLVAAGSSIGSVSGASSAEITGGSTGDLSVNGDVTATNGADIASISKAEDVTLAQAVTGDITASGKVTAATGTVMGDVTSGSASMSGAKAKSLSTGALSVTPEGFAADGSISADGVVSIAGGVVAGKSISLKGAAGSAISGVDVTAGDKLTLDGTIAAENTTLTGANGVAVLGTLEAGKGVAFAGGAVTGTGTINKTGGDTLALAGNTDLTGGAVNVDASTLAAADGAKLGSVVLKGASMTVAGSSIGSVAADNLKADAASSLEADVDLAARSADKTVVSGKVDLNGATVSVAPTSLAAEGTVADQTRINLISGSVTSGANEDVTHSMDTLNAHIENTANGVDLVLSKNYKGAENKTQNQSATADALASINPAGVPADSQLANVLEALGHTRSEADAKLALDSLSGAGLAGLQKAIAEDAKEHMQTLRATMKALNADVQRRYDENGIIPGVQSSAISASVTGGTAELSGDENCGDYTRSSFGGMVAMAHALYNGWTFGSSFAFSYADAECGDVNMDGEFIYVDLAMMHKGKRLSQTGTIGASFINFDTERDVRVNAPGHSFAGRAEGSTSAVAINMSYEMAYDLIKSDDGHRLGSVVMAEATFAQIDGMTESGLGNAGVNAEFDDVASLTFGIGARYTYEFGAKDNPGYFNLDVMAVAEAGDNTPKVNNMFIGGGQTYELVGPEAGTIGLRLNAGVLLPIGQQTGIFGNVTSEFRSEQTSVGGSVGVKYSF